MGIRVALNHRTAYHYDRPVTFTPQVVRLRPAPHCRTPVLSYSLKIDPADHFINWQQDPYSNYLARLVFNKMSSRLVVEVDLVVDISVINPFDFFIEEEAQTAPFEYDPTLVKELAPYFEVPEAEPRLASLVAEVREAYLQSEARTIDLIVGVNQHVQKLLKYIIRMEPGVQTPQKTLELGSGSCRDFAWLMVHVLRHLGLAARFVSGYSIQLKPDLKPLEGPSGVTVDCCDLHAWTEVYIPGAGWVGLDATSGLLASEGHIPLACGADPTTAAPITGSFAFTPRGPSDKVVEQFDVRMSVTRIHEDPRVTKPYTDSQWREIERLGEHVDDHLIKGDVRLTMGGEPTFVSLDDREGAEWNTEAVGPNKRRLGDELIRRLHSIYAPGGLLHFGQGKWYPGEQLPRWALSCYWRRDGQPVWNDRALFADSDTDYGFGADESERFIGLLAERLGVESSFAVPGYEDAWYYIWKERKLPVNVDPLAADLEDPLERKRLARLMERGLGKVVGHCLPLSRWYGPSGGTWQSGAWFFRPQHMFLMPGDSPMGYRLPLDSLPTVLAEDFPHIYEQDPMELRGTLPGYDALIGRHVPGIPALTTAAASSHGVPPRSTQRMLVESITGGPGHAARETHWKQIDDPAQMPHHTEPSSIIRTAICVEPRDGTLHVFMPPVRYMEDYLDLTAAVEETAAALHMPVSIEGYHPPNDHRLTNLRVTPDPGVLEVNLQPATTWDEMIDITTTLYDQAHQTRLGTEKFMLDGRHTGTGGGNHVVLGGATPPDSPFLRRPDLLRSLVGYWHNHPSLSYLFSGTFIGSTSQAPRVDEGRPDALYELQLALEQVPDPTHAGSIPPWLVDRVLRNILTDLTGNTHRSEFSIDKLYSPDSSTGRLGLVEMRGFEMPPHARMSLTQQLVIRALVARFWEKPYKTPLVDWGTQLHDRFLLPHFAWADFEDVVADLSGAGYLFKPEWFAPHFEFRFPFIGSVAYRNVELDLRQAVEPWNVLGEEPAGGATARFVDTSIERVQLKLRGLVDTRHVVACNGREVPLHPTGVNGEYVAGVRYRAWQPAACLHPTIGVHAPLVFDIFDTWNQRSIGGCTYHVAHPGGRNHTAFPVNAYEAEGRRSARFFKLGHTPGPMAVTATQRNERAPFTLDLRRKP
jgi:uncharacterized protein (DUF2126 family)/transglutaminase-like putative cysteine protease